ncbi:MAG: YjfB family protein [Roseburia hominis]|nr:YjfB family protein [Roseburia hominis]
MDFSNVDLALGTLTAYDSGSSVNSGSLAYAVGTAVLSQSLDLTQQMGASMIQMMEHSVNPELGGNIDMYV